MDLHWKKMDSDPGSQNVADPTDPAPGHEHLFKS